MTKKQKKVLIRIIVAAILLVILHFVPLEGLWLGLLYLIPYAVIGYDILRKADATEEKLVKALNDFKAEFLK